MDNKIDKFKYAWLKNPYDCPIEELKKQVVDLHSRAGYFETKQLAIKKFINSVYGALGSKHFFAHNTAIAESITAQGRDLNHFSENSVNRYFSGIFQSNPDIILHYQWIHIDKDGKRFDFGSKEKPEDYYASGTWEECESYVPAVKKGKRLTPDLIGCIKDNSQGHCDWFKRNAKLWDKLKVNPELARTFDISKGKTTESKPLTGPEYDYLDGTESLSVAGDTDSIDGNSVIDINDEKIAIRDAFAAIKYMNIDTVIMLPNGTQIVPAPSDITLTTKTYDASTDTVCDKQIKYIMRHKVKKSKYKITTESGKEVIVTGDHSCMVVRDGILISVTAQEINPETDKIITI